MVPVAGQDNGQCRTRQQLLRLLLASMLHQFQEACATLQLRIHSQGKRHHSLASIPSVVSEHSQVGRVLLKLCSSKHNKAWLTANLRNKNGDHDKQGCHQVQCSPPSSSAAVLPCLPAAASCCCLLLTSCKLLPPSTSHKAAASERTWHMGPCGLCDLLEAWEHTARALMGQCQPRQRAHSC